MNLYVKLIGSLAFFSGVASGLLSLTFAITAPVIAEREKEDQEKALQNVFFLQGENGGGPLVPKPMAEGVTALYASEDARQPLYFAATGEGTGYNSAVPVTLMVGFTGPAAAADLLKGYVPNDRLPPAGGKERYIVGFSVIKSEETPGLGERVKDSRPPFTMGELLTGNAPPANPDKATPFQSQFRGRTAGSLALKKGGGDLDAITAATITSNGVLAAIRNADEKLAGALSAPPK
ncbi:MAG: FMN-binding protein [Planctomycetota bacterium]|jgi:RnfABCDGE-type electron transport complex G subunit|nr:FMN-binding protein [Planctomycetota bacterium]